MTGSLGKTRLVQGGLLVYGATLVWQASNFAFNLVAARTLGPVDYGSLAAIVALLYVTTPLFVCVQTVSCRVTATLGCHDRLTAVRPLLVLYGRRLLWAGLALFAATVIASQPIARFLHVSAASQIIILGVGFIFAFLVHLQRGVLQGSMRFGRYAFSTLAEAATKTVVACVMLLWAWRSVEGALSAIVVGSLAALVLNQLLLRFLRHESGGQGDEAREGLLRYSLATLACLIMLAALLSGDVLAAKHYLGPHEAGLYAAVSLCGKIVFFLTAALAIYLFPVFSDRHERGKDARLMLGGALGIVAAGSGVVVAVSILAPSMIVSPLFGSRFAAADRYLMWIAIAFAAYSAVYLLAMYLLANKRAAGLGVLACGMLVQATLLTAFHTTIWHIIAVDVIVFAATAVALSALCLQPQEARMPVVESTA